MSMKALKVAADSLVGSMTSKHDFDLVLEVVVGPLRGLVAGARRGELVHKRHVGNRAR